MIPSDTKIFLGRGATFTPPYLRIYERVIKTFEYMKEEKEMADSIFMKAEEIMKALGVSQSEAYRIIKRLNEELKEKGYMVVSGRVSRRYLEEKMGSLDLEL